MEPEPINATDFVTWLLNKPPGEIAGHPNMGHACPLANYYHQQNPESHIYVGGDYYMVDGREFLAPIWMQRFTGEVDLRRKPITASECLNIIRAIPEDAYQEVPIDHKQ